MLLVGLLLLSLVGLLKVGLLESNDFCSFGLRRRVDRWNDDGLRLPLPLAPTPPTAPSGLLTGLLRPLLIVPGTKLKDPVILFFLRCDAFKVPCRDNVLWDPKGLLDSWWANIGDFGTVPVPAPVDKVLLLAAVSVFGLRRSDGLRRVRKLWDLALRILA